ncbi:MAG: IclR family transcriptional regulator [Desulfocapsaceae bacterium]|nr:IclR family transcriptional regulator [Desulfocapsaceae bacterium]
MRINKSTPRTIDIIKLLAERGEPLTLTEISTALKIPKTSTFDIITTLMDRNILEYENRQFKTIQLGLGLFEVTLLALGKRDLHRVARPYLDQILESTGETVYLAVENNGEVVYLERAEGSAAVRYSAELGARLPMYCTGLGKAILAAHPDEKVREILAGIRMHSFTPQTITNLMDLQEELTATRLRGYAIDNQEVTEGIFCVAAPIYGASDKPVAAISIASGTSMLQGGKMEKLGSLIAEKALNISRKLGFSKIGLFGQQTAG